MFKYDLTIYDRDSDQSQTVTIDVNFVHPLQFTSELIPHKSKYRQWVDHFEGKVYEPTLQKMIVNAYNYNDPQYSRIEVIKVLRVIDRDLGLKEAKDIVDSVYPLNIRDYQTPDFS